MQPSIAIVAPNTLASMGLSEIIRRMMPGVNICLFTHFAELSNHPLADTFYHYFVSADEVLSGATYFLQRQHKTIVLVHGNEFMHLPKGFHTLNVCQNEKELTASILSLAEHSHHANGKEPEVIRRAQHPTDDTANAKQKPILTPRERDVLKGIVKGLINKEIAACMGVSVATVITHRNNLTDKLGTRSVSALTIFAVMHGIVSSDELL